jgi:phenylalanyl-tRNA synthetase alpha chain
VIHLFGVEFTDLSNILLIQPILHRVYSFVIRGLYIYQLLFYRLLGFWQHLLRRTLVRQISSLQGISGLADGVFEQYCADAANPPPNLFIPNSPILSQQIIPIIPQSYPICVYLRNMEQLVQQIEAYRQEIAAAEANSPEAVEEFRIKYLGTKGLVKSIMGEMRNVPNERKKEFGQILNDFKLFVEGKYETLKENNSQLPTPNSQLIDWSLPGDPVAVGTRHPLNIVRNQIVSIFKRLGFAVAEGPEIEDDWHNFGAMNLPEDHPARDMQDTFYINQNPSWLLRTHTSSVQARVMETQKPPIRVICPGRVYRNETISARAHCFFHQVEGLYIDENVSFADLKQTLYFFVQEMFGNDVKVRFRPSYFPFTEPSAEMDISCLICKGNGCNICKHTGWVEILGSGMVHPNVLENFGIDSNKYTGFAFGMGVERITQLKYQVNDLRLYSQNDVRFLKQFTGVV